MVIYRNFSLGTTVSCDTVFPKRALPDTYKYFKSGIFIIFAAAIYLKELMEQSSPAEVLRAVATDFKIHGFTHAIAAQKLGLKNKQTVSNLLTSKKYFSERQADKFGRVFGYNKEFLCHGTGQLLPPTKPEPSTSNCVIDEQPLQYIHRPKPNRENPGYELDCILYWTYDILFFHQDKEGLRIWAEMSKFAQAKNLVKASLAGYKGDAYEKEYEERLAQLQASSISRITDMISNIEV